jgi:hypothetical protein
VDHAAAEGWSGPALQQVLARTLELFREDATGLLAPAMTCALRSSHHAVADEVWRALQQAVPCTTQYEGVIGALAAAGQLERVQWVLQECPYVLVRLGAAPARAALEHGHMEVSEGWWVWVVRQPGPCPCFLRLPASLDHGSWSCVFALRPSSCGLQMVVNTSTFNRNFHLPTGCSALPATRHTAHRWRSC